MREQVLYPLRKQIADAVSCTRVWLRNKPQTQRRLITGGAGLVIVALLTLVAAIPAITRASETDVLGNGGFEHGFSQIDGCGMVGNHWNCFTNGGAAEYGFYDDQWDRVIYEGKHSQLIEINTKNMAAGDNDRYAGISQTARVVPGKPYTFSLRGMIRSTSTEGDPWRYSVQVGWVSSPNGNWQDVTNWVDVGWNTYYSRTEPGAFSAFQTQLVPDSDVITVFVRVWKKWGVAFEELDVNLDAISLTGPAVHVSKDVKPGGGPSMGVGGPLPGEGYKPEQFPQQPQPQAPQGPQAHENHSQEYRPTYRPSTSNVDDYPVSCGGPNFVSNGSFEEGFVPVPWGVVGKDWEAFTNGGAANYGFYDEQWDVVVADGDHGQLIEINSKAIFPTDPDRYAGIYQRIGGLKPGATYELTLRAGLRGAGNEDDPYRFAAQWGLGKDGDWQSVEEWTEMNLGPIGVRTQPVPLAQYKVRFEAPGPNAVLFIRGWKKWAITDVEMDFNLDAISVRACDTGGASKPPQGGWQEPTFPGTGGPTNQPGPCSGPCGGDQNPGSGPNCLYVVKPGDTLSQIALNFGVSMDAIMRANGIRNASEIFVGQKFEIPGCNSGQSVVPASQANSQSRASQEYVIAQGQRPADASNRPGPTVRPDVQTQAPQQSRQQRTYVVKEGDMLSAIALAHGVNAYDLAAYNGVDNLNFIYAGQVLAIPN